MQIAAICQEAGMHAVRKNRYVILPKDFEKGYRANVKKPDTDFEFYKWRESRSGTRLWLLLKFQCVLRIIKDMESNLQLN